MSFDFSAWKGPRSITQIKADHAAEDARARRAAEATQVSAENLAPPVTQPDTATPTRKAA